MAGTNLLKGWFTTEDAKGTMFSLSSLRASVGFANAQRGNLRD
jgi:hypothetical protein